MPKHSGSSQIIDSTQKQKHIYKKRSSMGGPAPSSNNTHYLINNNQSIGQIIAGPLRIKVKRKSLVSNKAPTSTNQAPISGQRYQASKEQSPAGLKQEQSQSVLDNCTFRPTQPYEETADQESINAQQNEIQAKNLDQFDFARQIKIEQQQVSKIEVNQGHMVRQTNLQHYQGIHQINNKTGASFKKIRKQSHIKHNSIDRAHFAQSSTSKNKQADQFNFQKFEPSLKESKSKLLEEQRKLDESILSSQNMVRQQTSKKRQNQAPHTTKNLQGIGVLKKLILQQNPEQNVSIEQWDSVRKIMRSFDENPKKKSLSGNNKSNQNVTVLVNVKKQVKNVKKQKKIKSMSINQQFDDLQQLQSGLRPDQSSALDLANSVFINQEFSNQPIDISNQNQILNQAQQYQELILEQNAANIDADDRDNSPIYSKNVIYATQDHCNSKIIKKDPQKTIHKNMKKLNQNLLNVISPIGVENNQTNFLNKSQGASLKQQSGGPPSDPQKTSANLSQNRTFQNQAQMSQPSNPSDSNGNQQNSGDNSGCGTGGSNPNSGGTNNQLSNNNISSSAEVSGSKSIYKSFDQHRIDKQQHQNKQQINLGIDLVGSYSKSRKSGPEDDMDLKFSNQFGTFGMKSSSHQLEGLPKSKGSNKLTKEQMKQSILLNQRVHQQQILSSTKPQVSTGKQKQKLLPTATYTNNQNKFQQIDQLGTNNSGSNNDNNGKGLKKSQPSEGNDQIFFMQQQLSQGKSVISSQKSKKTGKGGNFKLYSTEDNRSSFTGIIKGQKSKKSSGNGGHLNSGSGSGNNHYATMNALQNKTTSSKNTNTFRKTRRKQGTNAQSGEYANVSKKGNFLDEFSQFEEQFEKNQQKQKIFVNEQRIQENDVHAADKRNSSKEKRLQTLLGRNPGNNQIINTSFVNQQKDEIIISDKLKFENQKQQISNSRSSDRLLVGNLSQINQNNLSIEEYQQQLMPNLQNQNQISEQYDSYMRDFQMVTNKLLAQKKIIDSQRSCEQCNIYQQIYERNQQQRQIREQSLLTSGSNNENQNQQMQLNEDSQYIGTYKGHDYQHIQHNLMTQPQGPGRGQPLACYCPQHQQQILLIENQNQIVSQSRVIIPRGIVNFKKVHSLSNERRNHSLNLMGPQNSSNINPQNVSQTAHYQRSVQIHNQSQSQPPRQGNAARNQSMEDATRNEIQPIVATGGTGEAPNNHYSSQEDEDNQREIDQRETVQRDQNMISQPNQQLNLQNVLSSNHSQDSQAENTFLQSQGTFNQPMGSFLLEPRDQSLMRKKKVIEILKTFQEQDENEVTDKRGSLHDSKGALKESQNNFGEDINQADKNNQKQKKQNIGPLIQSFQKDPKNLTYQVGKPIIIKQQNRVKKQIPKGIRRRDQIPVEKRVSGNIGSDEQIADGNNLMSDLNDFIMCEDQKINQQEEKFITQTRKNQEMMLQEMLDNEDYSDVDDPFLQKPSSINPAMIDSIVDDDQNEVEELGGQVHNDLELAKELDLMDHQAIVDGSPQEIATNCQVQDLLGNDLIQPLSQNQKDVSSSDFLGDAFNLQKNNLYPMATSSEYPSGSPPHFLEEAQQASSQYLQLQTQIKNIDQIFEVDTNNNDLGTNVSGAQILSPHIIQNRNSTLIQRKKKDNQDRQHKGIDGWLDKKS